MAAALEQNLPHVPVLLGPLLAGVAPVSGHWLDGTLGAGGYTRGLLEAGADRVTGIDRDPYAISLAKEWGAGFAGRLALFETEFSKMHEVADGLDGVVLDLGVSSMQIDQPERGFSFMQDGPLDMRMSQSGTDAGDLIRLKTEEELADIIYHFGEERAARRIAKAIVRARTATPIETTGALVEIVEGCLPRPKPGQSHPATRTFQALRIAVNAEYEELFAGLMAAEKALASGGKLAVVTFHSVEDRIVKRFLNLRSGRTGGTSRYAPEKKEDAPTFEVLTRKAVSADADELEANPRSRSAKLRIAVRTDVPAGEIDAARLGVPRIGVV